MMHFTQTRTHIRWYAYTFYRSILLRVHILESGALVLHYPTATRCHFFDFVVLIMTAKL